jgi:hypothetical protein
MKKFIIFLFAVSIVAFFLYKISISFNPGNFGNAERFQINIGEEQLIEFIEEFKRDNPEHRVPSHVQLLDHRNNHWYVIYFYYPQENEIILTWTRPASKDRTTFALVSVSNVASLGTWADINKDLTPMESRAQIDRFEQLILSDIRKRIRNK